MQGHLLFGTPSPIHAIDFNADHTQLISGGNDGTVHVWDVETGQLTAILTATFSVEKGRFDYVRSVVFHDRYIIGGRLDSTIAIWRSADGQLDQELGQPRTPIWSMDISPNREWLAVGSGSVEDEGWFSWTNDNTSEVTIWRLTDYKIELTLEGHTDVVSSIAFSPDGTLLASGSYDRTIRIWSIN